MDLDYRKLFEAMHPGFFQQAHLASHGPDEVFEEMVLDLSAFSPDQAVLPVPEGISFGLYRGDREKLLQAVKAVDVTWPPFFREDSRVYCAMEQDQIASFCLIEPMGQWQGLCIGGPGCVGTVPAYRRQGIGLKTVQNVTGILQSEGYDLSYIHYTGVAPWYARLGYRTVLKWNRDGILSAAPFL